MGRQKTDPETTTMLAIAVPEGSKATTINTKSIPLDHIKIRNKNDRSRDAAFEAGIRGLAASMAQIGLQQPIVLIADPKSVGTDTEAYSLASGERRLAAAELLGWKTIAAHVLPPAGVSIEDARLAENIQREDLNDERKALQIGERLSAAEAAIHAEMGVKEPGMLEPPAADAVRRRAVKVLAARIGWPENRVREYVFVAELPKKTRALAGAGRLSLGHLRALAQVSDPKRCDELAETHAAGENPAMAPMKSLDDLNRVIRRELANLEKVAWSLDVAFAGGPACMACANNSKNRHGLFDGEGKGYANHEAIDFEKADASTGICLKLSCFSAKNAATKGSIRNAGDRIAAKIAAAAPKERPMLLGQLTRAAQEKASFVKPTVFGKEVRERVESKLEKPKGKAGKKPKESSASWTRETPEEHANRELAVAIQSRNAKISQMVRPELKKLDRARLLLINLALQTTAGVQASAWKENKGTSKAVGDLNWMITACMKEPVLQAFNQIAGRLSDDSLEIGGHQMSRATRVWEMLAAQLGVGELPSMPTLEHFLPKLEKAEKSKMSQPAKSGEKTKPAAKKRARKSKMSAASNTNRIRDAVGAPPSDRPAVDASTAPLRGWHARRGPGPYDPPPHESRTP